MRLRSWGLFFTVLMLTNVAWGDENAAWQQLLTATGTLRLIDTIPGGDLPNRILAVQLSALNPQVRLTVQREWTPRQLAADEILLSEENENAAVGFTGLKFTYLYQPLVFYVNAGNPLKAVTERNTFNALLQDQTWADLGGNKQLLKRCFYNSSAERTHLNAGQWSNATDADAFLAQIASGIWTLGIGPYLPDVPPKVRVLPVFGVMPTAQNIRSGRYWSKRRTVQIATNAGSLARCYYQVLQSGRFAKLVNAGYFLSVR